MSSTTNRPVHQPNFLEAITGLVFEPGYTTDLLLNKNYPPYIPGIIICFLLTVAVPLVAFIVKNNAEFENAASLLGIIFALVFTFVLFILFEGVLLLILRISATPFQLLGIASYCLVPLMFAIWLIYLFNFFSDGRLTVAELMVTGYAPISSQFLKVLPVAFIIVQVNLFLLVFYSLKSIGALSFFSALFITLLSGIPFYLAFILGVFLGDIVHTGTIDTFQTLLLNIDFSVIFGFFG